MSNGISITSTANVQYSVDQSSLPQTAIDGLKAHTNADNQVDAGYLAILTTLYPQAFELLENNGLADPKGITEPPDFDSINDDLNAIIARALRNSAKANQDTSLTFMNMAMSAASNMMVEAGEQKEKAIKAAAANYSASMISAGVEIGGGALQAGGAGFSANKIRQSAKSGLQADRLASQTEKVGKQKEGLMKQIDDIDRKEMPKAWLGKRSAEQKVADARDEVDLAQRHHGPGGLVQRDAASEANVNNKKLDLEIAIAQDRKAGVNLQKTEAKKFQLETEIQAMDAQVPHAARQEAKMRSTASRYLETTRVYTQVAGAASGLVNGSGKMVSAAETQVGAGLSAESKFDDAQEQQQGILNSAVTEAAHMMRDAMNEARNTLKELASSSQAAVNTVNRNLV